MYITWNIYLLRYILHIFFIFVFSFKGKPTAMVADLLQMSRHGGTGAETLKNGIDKIFKKDVHLPIQNCNGKMVSFKSDEASVNMEQNEGLMTRMKRSKRDWLVPIHYVNHRVELVIKDSFDESPFSVVHKLYNTLFSLFKNSGDIKSNVRQAAEVLEISFYTLPKLTGTQFVSHWRGVFTFLLNMWSAIVIALGNRLTALKHKPYSRAKISGLVTELHSY